MFPSSDRSPGGGPGASLDAADGADFVDVLRRAIASGFVPPYNVPPPPSPFVGYVQQLTAAVAAVTALASACGTTSGGTTFGGSTRVLPPPAASGVTPIGSIARRRSSRRDSSGVKPGTLQHANAGSGGGGSHWDEALPGSGESAVPAAGAGPLLYRVRCSRGAGGTSFLFAVAQAVRNAGAFPGGIVFADVRGVVDGQAQLAAVCRAVGLVVTGDAGTTLSRWCAGRPDPTLVLLDCDDGGGVDDAASCGGGGGTGGSPVLSVLLQSRRVAVVATARDSDSAASISGRDWCRLVGVSVGDVEGLVATVAGHYLPHVDVLFRRSKGLPGVVMSLCRMPPAIVLPLLAGTVVLPCLPHVSYHARRSHPRFLPLIAYCTWAWPLKRHWVRRSTHKRTRA